MKRKVDEYLGDILEQIERIESHVVGLDFQAFTKDNKTQDAVVRCLEIIGEASRQMPEDFKTARPEIPWRDIIGTRTILIHDYLGVDLVEVWRTVEKNLPELKDQIEKILAERKQISDK